MLPNLRHDVLFRLKTASAIVSVQAVPKLRPELHATEDTLCPELPGVDLPHIPLWAATLLLADGIWYCLARLHPFRPIVFHTLPNGAFFAAPL